MKQRILSDICGKLTELQIPFSVKEDSYIYVNTDFYEIGYGADFKKISYELNVFLDEPGRSVSMYVKTVDQCLVAANGASKDLTSPSTTIFRKVKRYVYDKDGQGSIVTTDLGEVPNTIKNTAFRYGWKFSTALNLNKLHKMVGAGDVRLSEPETSETPPGTGPETPDTPPVAAAKKKGRSSACSVRSGGSADARTVGSARLFTYVQRQAKRVLCAFYFFFALYSSAAISCSSADKSVVPVTFSPPMSRASSRLRPSKFSALT
jgi:hypothetical protein